MRVGQAGKTHAAVGRPKIRLFVSSASHPISLVVWCENGAEH